jgi:glycosyltransferase involved in cell wall biosynthesis
VTPLVSICLPSLNTRPFLKERFDSIYQQTFQDWELFVYDSHSDDGSWDFICDVAAKDNRVRIAQGPRDGVYPAWNECLKQTRGEFVYIATSDDSMSPDLMEKMVAALQFHQDCELAHCPLVIVDERSRRVEEQTWPDGTVFADGLPDIGTAHVWRAPYSGLMQLSGRHVILSITQLLIRRSIFSRIGNFTNRWGSPSDFHWEMKAGLVANMVHVPDTWATWRIHSNQATNESRGISRQDYFQKVDDMIRHAVAESEALLPEGIATDLKSYVLRSSEELRSYYLNLWYRESPTRRRLYQALQVLQGTPSVRREILRRITGKPKWYDNVGSEVRQWLESRGLQPLVRCSQPTAHT